MRCPNDTRNPTVRLSDAGLCQVCQRFDEGFDLTILERELAQVTAMIGSGRGPYDAMVGVSGGKDSTACLIRTLRLGFTPLAFTFTTGYYPAHIAVRGRQVADLVGADHEVIDLRTHIRPSDAESFARTADLYDLPESERTARLFRSTYIENRRRYSIRHDAPSAYVRTCQLCRRLVVRAYHREATARGVPVIIVGTNEWVGLSQNPNRGGYHISGVRRLQPPGAGKPVFVVHLPFLLRTTLNATTQVLDRIGWRPPDGEELIESNANSCLLSRTAQAKATRMLGFHPDTSRLAREVTAGFLAREQALQALAREHPSPRSVRTVLTAAGLL